LCCVFLPADQDAAAAAGEGEGAGAGAAPALPDGRAPPTLADLQQAKASVIRKLAQLEPTLSQAKRMQLAEHMHELLAAFDSMWESLSGIRDDIELSKLQYEVGYVHKEQLLSLLLLSAHSWTCRQLSVFAACSTSPVPSSQGNRISTRHSRRPLNCC
jgi:hypothetical protein